MLGDWPIAKKLPGLVRSFFWGGLASAWQEVGSIRIHHPKPVSKNQLNNLRFRLTKLVTQTIPEKIRWLVIH